jgi:hypothetical protein
VRLAVVGLLEGTGCVVRVAERTLDYSAPRHSFQASVHHRSSYRLVYNLKCSLQHHLNLYAII